jgi:hypothetical protein
MQKHKKAKRTQFLKQLDSRLRGNDKKRATTGGLPLQTAVLSKRTHLSCKSCLSRQKTIFAKRTQS